MRNYKQKLTWKRQRCPDVACINKIKKGRFTLILGHALCSLVKTLLWLKYRTAFIYVEVQSWIVFHVHLHPYAFVLNDAVSVHLTLASNQSNKHTLESHVCLLRRKMMICGFLVFNVTFSNISAISWRPVLVMEEAGVQYPERTIDHGQGTGKLYHLRLRVECTLFCKL